MKEQLKFGNMPLDDNKTLCDYQVPDGSTLDLASVANAKPIALTVYTDDTFDNIQKKVKYKTGIPPKEQLLSVDGQPVEDDDIPNNGIVVCQLVNH